MDRLIIDTDTGDAIGTLFEGDRIIRKKIIEILPVEDNRMAFNNGEWGKTYDLSFKKLSRLKLDVIEYRMTLLFMSLVSYGSGLIIHGNSKLITTEWFENELDISHKVFEKSLIKLLDYRIISQSYSGKEKIYFFNPYIYQKGKYINKTLFEMFKKSEWAKEELKK
jgi:hypothetical protein